MWLARPSDKSCAAAPSRSTDFAPGRASCSSCSPTTRMSTTKPGLRKRRSPVRPACQSQGYGRRSDLSSRRASSRSSIRADHVEVLDIGSRFGRTYGQLGDPYLARVMGNSRVRNSLIAMGNPVTSKVVTTHVRRSAVAMRALPGARRSLRSLIGILIAERGIHGGGRRLRWSLPPEGDGRGERAEMVESRIVTVQRAHDCAASRRRWLRMTSGQDGRFRHPADRTVDALEVAVSQPDHATRAGRSSLDRGEQQPYGPDEQRRAIDGQEAELGESLRVSGCDVLDESRVFGGHVRYTPERGRAEGLSFVANHEASMRAARFAEDLSGATR